MAVNTLEEFETLPESLVAEFVDGRIRVFNSFTTAQHEIRNEIGLLRLQHLKLYHGSVQPNYKNIWMQLYRNIGLLIWKHDWFLCTDPLLVKQA